MLIEKWDTTTTTNRKTKRKKNPYLLDENSTESDAAKKFNGKRTILKIFLKTTETKKNKMIIEENETGSDITTVEIQYA